MNDISKMQRIAILGAGGNMGREVLMRIMIEMLTLKLENKPAPFTLYAVDNSEQALSKLMGYIHSQTLKFAEKNIVWLRKAYADRNDLIENEEIIRECMSDIAQMILPVPCLEPAYHTNLVFETLPGDEKLKIKILKQINDHHTDGPWFFTNTSSVPVKLLNEKAKLDGKITGFQLHSHLDKHGVLKIIPANNTRQELVDFGNKLAEKINKLPISGFPAG